MIQGARTELFAESAAPDPDGEPEAWQAAGEEGIVATPPRRWPAMLGAGVLLLAALLWIGMLVGMLVGAGARVSGLRLLAWIGLGSGPLALIGVLALLLVRSGRLHTADVLAASARLRADVAALGDALTRLNAQVLDARAQLGGHADALSGLGAETGERLTHAAAQLGGQAEAFRRTAAALDDATATARADLGVLLADLPRAEAVTVSLSERLRNGGAEADAQARTLADALGLLEERARAAGETTGGAAARLAGQLDRIDGTATAAEQRIAATAEAMHQAVDRALNSTATGVEEARRAVAEQSAALTAMVDQGRASLDLAGDEAVQRLGGRLSGLAARLDGIGRGVAEQDQAVRALLARLEEAAQATEARLVGLRGTGVDQAGDLATSLDALQDHAEAVTRLLAAQDRAATSLLDRVTQVRGQAEAGGLLLGETLPAALARVRLHAEQSMQAVAVLGERGERLHDTTDAVATRLVEAEEALRRQQQMLGEVEDRADARVTLITDKTNALRTLVARTEEDIQALNQGAAGELVEALFRVREAANEAGEQARDALTAAIPRAAQRLGESASRALTGALADIGQAEIDAVGAAAAQAVEAARAASERLAHQLVTIAETATAIDARIAANQSDTETHDQASFARTAGLLIEALNSSAIDLTRLFASEVSEDAWKAYLRGERGVFTRRAVRLLERSEAGALAHRYEGEPEFQAQVNRYIHDFEALLRRVMATNEGEALATALLSSDMGKLYVALAQAIERLRR